MSATLTLLLIVAAAFLAAHVAFEWLARRFLVVSGAEYLLLGVLLGPSVGNFIRPGVVGDFVPLMTLALGWIGAVIGAQFFVPALVRIPAVHFRIAWVEALLSFVLISTGAWVLMRVTAGVAPVAAILPAGALGAVGTASAPTGIALMSRTLRRRGAVVRQLQVTTAVDAAVAILAFGVLLSVDHPVGTISARPPTATEWVVISLAIGIVGGSLFHLFLGSERDEDRLFVALAGALILASGAAAHLRLTPLLPTMIIGAILVNTSRNRGEIERVLLGVERPLYFILLVFAGAAWVPATGSLLVTVVGFLGLRLAAKLVAAWVGARAHGAVGPLGAGWGRALLGQGGLAVAIALDYRLSRQEVPYADLVFTAALASVLLTDVLGARLASPVVGAEAAGRGGATAGGGSGPQAPRG